MKKDEQKNTPPGELDTILRFGSLINSSLNIEDVLDHAMKWAEEFMDAEASSVYELNRERNEIFIRSMEMGIYYQYQETEGLPVLSGS